MKFLKTNYEMHDGSFGGGFSVRSYETYLKGVRRKKDMGRWWRYLVG